MQIRVTRAGHCLQGLAGVPCAACQKAQLHCLWTVNTRCAVRYCPTSPPRKVTFSQMKTGVLTVPAGFGERFPSQTRLLSTETEMVTLLITVLPPSVKLGKMAGGKKPQPLYCHFCVPVLSAIENDGGAGQKVSHRQGGDTASCLTGSFSRGQSCT